MTTKRKPRKPLAPRMGVPLLELWAYRTENFTEVEKSIFRVFGEHAKEFWSWLRAEVSGLRTTDILVDMRRQSPREYAEPFVRTGVVAKELLEHLEALDHHITDLPHHAYTNNLEEPKTHILLNELKLLINTIDHFGKKYNRRSRRTKKPIPKALIEVGADIAYWFKCAGKKPYASEDSDFCLILKYVMDVITLNYSQTPYNFSAKVEFNPKHLATLALKATSPLETHNSLQNSQPEKIENPGRQETAT